MCSWEVHGKSQALVLGFLPFSGISGRWLRVFDVCWSRNARNLWLKTLICLTYMDWSMHVLSEQYRWHVYGMQPDVLQVVIGGKAGTVGILINLIGITDHDLLIF